MARKLFDKYKEMIVNTLAKEGATMIEEAAKTKDTKVVTGNQLDAYGYIIYYNGEVQLVGYLDPFTQATEKHEGWKAMGIDANTGRGWLAEFTQKYKVPRDGKFALVVVNAAFYTDILERGAGRLTKKYRVISQVASSADRIARKYKGHSTYFNYIG